MCCTDTDQCVSPFLFFSLTLLQTVLQCLLVQVCSCTHFSAARDVSSRALITTQSTGKIMSWVHEVCTLRAKGNCNTFSHADLGGGFVVVVLVGTKSKTWGLSRCIRGFDLR